MGPPLSWRDKKITNYCDTVAKTLAEIISTYLYVYNCKVLVAGRLIRDLLYDILLSLKALVFICNFKSVYIFISVPEFHTSHISMQTFTFLQMFKSPFHKECPQHRIPSLLLSREDLEWDITCLSPALSQNAKTHNLQ